MLKSNITVRSNIYNRISANPENDPDFVRNISGGFALGAIKKRLDGTDSLSKLTKAQEQERLESSACSEVYNKKREQTHGPVFVDGEIMWVCRCENYDCEMYEECMSASYAKRIVRSEPVSGVDEELPVSLSYQFLGLRLDDFESVSKTDDELPSSPSYELLGLLPEVSESVSAIFEEPFFESLPEEELPPEIVITDPAFFETAKDGFEVIKDPSVIIKAPLTEKVLVNAGPGTGKTYTVIHRLEYIIKNNMADLSQLLVICYTRAAKQVIQERLESGIASGYLPAAARAVAVCTLDSLATMYLSEIEADFAKLNYDERIAMFNRKIDPKIFDNFEYVIIDELQDIVNQRAEMVLNILKNISCAFLLLGDKCQAIYDYDCHKKGMEAISSVRFYELLNKNISIDTRRYELTANMRQVPKLADYTNNLREALLSFEASDANDVFKEELSKLQIASQKAENFCPQPTAGESAAILCRNNGEAEYISSQLYKKGIQHTLLRGSGHPLSYHRWIADVFWDYREPLVSRDGFIERYKARVVADERRASLSYGALCELCDVEHERDIKLENLAEMLMKSVAPPAELLNKECENLVVSTIHRAKGREFDTVYLLESELPKNSADTEEARVRYVGVTRPRVDLKILEKSGKWHLLKNDYGRWFFRGNLYGRYCKNLSVGMPGDVDITGFVDESIGEWIDIQHYIATQVKPGDVAEITRSGDNYCIVHQGNTIGRLTDGIDSDFWSAIKRTDRRDKIPQRLYDVYISNIVTIVQRQHSERIPLWFRESRFWLGVEITGFAKIDWK